MRFKHRFPHYDVLDKRDSPSWNDQTRRVIDERLHHVPTRRFFDPEEWSILEAVCARIIPQPDRPQHPVPIAPHIDGRMVENRGDGYRFADMPPMQEAWRLGLKGIEDESLKRYGASFTELPPEDQDAILRHIQKGDVVSEIWQDLPPVRFFAYRILQDILPVYYSHPEAWNEIGFGGPASPRGYVRLGFNRRDPWESEEECDE